MHSLDSFLRTERNIFQSFPRDLYEQSVVVVRKPLAPRCSRDLLICGTLLRGDDDVARRGIPVDAFGQVDCVIGTEIVKYILRRRRRQ